MYSLHLTHPKWTHTRSSGQPCYSARGAVGGSVPCSRTPQSWYWRRILPPPTIPAGPEIRTHNLPLTSPTRYPLGHDCPYGPRLPLLRSLRFVWALFFTRFHFTITYRPGNQNPKADALSRLHAPDQPSEPEPILPPALIVSPIQWELTKRICDTTRTEPAPQGGPEGKTYMPSSQHLTILDSVHEVPGSGHPGSQRTLSLLQARYWWPSMAEDVIRYVRSCSVCAMSKTPRHLPAGKLVPLPVPQRPWSHIGVDFITDLPNSEGHTCVLVDRFSKACKLIPLKGLPTALETAESLFLHVFQNYGLPVDIVSDTGPQFISHVWKAFFQLLGVTVSLSSGYHPQTNGQTERKIQELGRYLRSYCSNDQHSWSRFLPWAEYAQKSLRQSTTGLTPFQCILCYQPPLFPWTEEPSEVPAVDYWFRESERVWDSMHIHLQRAVRRHKFFADAIGSSCRPGTSPPPALQDAESCYIGPFPIQRQVNEVTYQLQLPSRYRIHPTFHVSLLKPFSPSTTGRTEPDTPPPPRVLGRGRRSVTFWTHGDGAPGLSTCWTGRDMDRRKDPGWPGTIS